jgi:2-oxoglutarate dehydrogenase complex dehydrogenase (E1) component-like enzyme
VGQSPLNTCTSLLSKIYQIPKKKFFREERDWVRRKVEKIPFIVNTDAQKLSILEDLIESEVLNYILEAKFPQ